MQMSVYWFRVCYVGIHQRA